MHRKESVIRATKKWIEEFVIGYNVCPFARPSYVNNAIHYGYSTRTELKELLMDFWVAVQLMEDSNQDPVISNSIFIIDSSICYHGLLEFGGICEEFLQEVSLSERYQIVEFHPDFMFAESEEGDAANYVNKSPIPFIHILRVNEVAGAIASHSDVESIPSANARNLRSIGADTLADKLQQTKDTILPSS